MIQARPLGICETLEGACKLLEKFSGRKIVKAGMARQDTFDAWECSSKGVYVGMIWRVPMRF